MTLRKLLLFLLQTVTVGLAAAFVYILLTQPERLQRTSSIVEVREAAPPSGQSTRAPDAEETHWRGPVSYADAVAAAAPAIVNVHTAKVITRRAHPLLEDPVFRHFFGDRLGKPRREIETSLGSGVIISSQGYVLTNNHVIDGADEIKVLLSDGRSTSAMVVGVDPDTDLAVLHIELDNLPTVVIGSSMDLRVGDVALAIGNPFGLDHTVTSGIVSAKERRIGAGPYDDFIQTDASINPGNSGGPLFNLSGQVVGINTAIAPQGQGIGFAIPSNMAQSIIDSLSSSGKVVRLSLIHI